MVLQVVKIFVPLNLLFDYFCAKCTKPERKNLCKMHKNIPQTLFSCFLIELVAGLVKMS